MAKGDVTLKFDAATAAFVQDVMKARAALEATADSARKLGESAKKSGDMLAGMTGQLTDLASGGKIAQVVLSGINEYLDKIEARAKALMENARKINNAAAGAGQGEIAGELRKQLDTFGQGTRRGVSINPKELDDAVLAAMKDIGAKSREFGPNAKKEFVAAGMAATDARNMGLDVETSQEAAINRARFALERQRGTGFKGWTDQQLDARAIEVAREMGTVDPRLQDIIGKSGNQDQMLDIAMATKDAGLRTKGLAALERAINQPKFDREKLRELRKKSHHGDVDAAADLRLDQIATADRSAAIVADPSLMHAEEQPFIRRMNVALGAYRKRGAFNVVSEINAFRRGLGPAGQAAETDRSQQAEREQITRRGAQHEAEYQNRKLEAENKLRNELGDREVYVPDAVIGLHGFFRGHKWGKTFAETDAEEKAKGDPLGIDDDQPATRKDPHTMEEMREKWAPIDKLLKNQLPSELSQVGGNSQISQQDKDINLAADTDQRYRESQKTHDPHLEALDKIHGALINIGAIHRTRRDTGLRNDSEGQQ